MARRKTREIVREEETKLEMTPMIDVVFQLLIFFIVTIKPEDIIAHLDVYRPSASKPEEQEKPPEMLMISIYRETMTLNDRRVNFETLEKFLTKLAGLSTTQNVVIRCAPDSRHEDLVRVLDLCAKVRLVNLSVFSM